MTFYTGKKVFVTGHSGFKGSWLCLWLEMLGARVFGYALPPVTTPALFPLLGLNLQSEFADIRSGGHLVRSMAEFRPEIIFHLAAQPLVRASYGDPLGTFETNVMGTANVLEAMRGLDTVRVAIMVTTDKVYRNMEWPFPYRENDHLGGHDPYSASKACSELITDCYRQAFFVPSQHINSSTALATARAGNVIGGGDWSEDRLIPDAIRAWQSSEPLVIRRPGAVRPWQHVLEPLAGYLSLAQALWNEPDLAGAYNFGPATHDAATVREVVQLAGTAYGRGEVVWGDSSDGPHEAGLLKLEIAKAQSILGFTPRWSLAEAVHRTMRWYKGLENGESARALCEMDIAAYGATFFPPQMTNG